MDCVQYTLDPVIPFVHRPLALYAVAETVGTVTGLALNLTGFHRRRSPCGNISYWYRQQQHDSFSEVSASQGLGPIVLFHGVGAGLLFCLQTIWKLCCGRVSMTGWVRLSAWTDVHSFRTETDAELVGRGLVTVQDVKLEGALSVKIQELESHVFKK